MAFTKVAEVETDERVVQHPAAQPKAENIALQMLLAAIGQRIGAFFHAFFVLLTVGSCWWLWLQAPPDPSVRQIVSLALYAAFILALHVIRRK